MNLQIVFLAANDFSVEALERLEGVLLSDKEQSFVTPDGNYIAITTTDRDGLVARLIEDGFDEDEIEV